jgi:hypothetical protein
MTSRISCPLRAVRTGLLLAGALSAPVLFGCSDVTRFTGTYSGAIVAGPFVRSNLSQTDSLCLILDASHLQDAPGTLTSGDGRFAKTPLRPIPQIWQDPLSTLNFGEGRVQNLVYIATPVASVDALGDVTVVLSLMQSGSVEVRLLRGAPTLDAGVGANNLFGVFQLSSAGSSSCSS